MGYSCIFQRYCIPMDSARPILPTELVFFNKGTGKGWYYSGKIWWMINIFTVPLVVVFTKFDAQIIQECGKLDDTEDKWDKARQNAEITFQNVYLPNVFDTKYPPNGYVCLGGMIMNTLLWLDGDNYFNRYGHSREWLSWIDWKDCCCHWWCQPTRIVRLNSNEQSWSLC